MRTTGVSGLNASASRTVGIGKSLVSGNPLTATTNGSPRFSK